MRKLRTGFLLRWDCIMRDRRGSPMVEEGILIGIGLFGMLIILSLITGVLDWFVNIANEILDQFGTYFSP